MKILIAPDSFKESVEALDVCHAIQSGFSQVFPDADYKLLPMADGGEGTSAVLSYVLGGRWKEVRVHDPLMRPINAKYLLLPDATAVIEVAQACGLHLLTVAERNPVIASSYGVGELIEDALNEGVKRIIIGLGGSATNDAGIGMLQALGFQFLDKSRKALGQGGETMEKIAHICTQNVHESLKNAHFIVACDVQNPFYGPNGAAAVYARQKGADDAMIEELDRGMRSFAQVILKETGRDISNIPGSGAAGGMGGGMLAFLNAELRSGADLLLDLSQFESKIADADLIITGEGRIDRQSLMGKIPGKILEIGKRKGIPVIAIAGCVEDEGILMSAGFKGIFVTKPDSMPLEEAMKPGIAQQNIKSVLASAHLETFI